MIFYDFEVFRYDWLVVVGDGEDGQQAAIVNDPAKLKAFYKRHSEDIWVGYNSRRYDQYILKALLLDMDPYKLSRYLLEGGQGYRYSELFDTLPLYNYDCLTSFHSLKQLEGFMGNDIRESTVSFEIDRPLTAEELAEVTRYCRHDMEQTREVFKRRREEYDSQLSLLEVFGLPLKQIAMTKAQLSALILGARKRQWQDEFALRLPPTLRLERYQAVAEWYERPENKRYDRELVVEVAGLACGFGWGGLHAALTQYHGHGLFLNIDVASYYPSLMIAYDYISRNVADPGKYREIRDIRLALKKKKDPMQQPYKIVLNSAYGAMKDESNSLYDPLQANNVTVAGQLLLLDLIEKLEDHCQLIQCNTDGLLVRLDGPAALAEVTARCAQWEERTGLQLEMEEYAELYQKDVNNYLLIDADGHYKAKGAYVKPLDNLDYDLPIVNKAMVAYMLHGTPVEETINACQTLRDFQKIVKISGKYDYALYGGSVLQEKVLRVFASISLSDGGIYKVRQGITEKVANTPDRCLIINDSVHDKPLPPRLDRGWYIALAEHRLRDFGAVQSEQLELF